MKNYTIDKTAGVIRGVSMLTGNMVAKGHPLLVDKTTLQQIHDCAVSMGQVPVKENHKSGAGEVTGFLSNFRIEGNQVKADWNLLKTYPRFEQILETAERMPSGVGLSVAFIGPKQAQFDKAGQQLARCAELLSCDYVTSPAANPDGLFATIDGRVIEFTAQPQQPQRFKKAAIAGVAVAGGVAGAKFGKLIAQKVAYRAAQAGENLAGKIIATEKPGLTGILHAGVATRSGIISKGPSGLRVDPLAKLKGKVFVQRGTQTASRSQIAKGVKSVKAARGYDPISSNCEHTATAIVGQARRSPQVRGTIAGALAGATGAGLIASKALPAKRKQGTQYSSQNRFDHQPATINFSAKTTNAINLAVSAAVKPYHRK
ncbi:MAG: hypothetical protein SFY80_00815 [Verrucomicrobiota bacterium]|nr:hypothetical protein [Verrucomicrobiota bacterium]